MGYGLQTSRDNKCLRPVLIYIPHEDAARSPDSEYNTPDYFLIDIKISSDSDKHY